MITISLSNPIEVLVAIVFVIIAVAALLGTFGLAVAYVYSNVKERWPEYSAEKRRKVVTNIVVTLAVITILILLASTKLR